MELARRFDEIAKGGIEEWVPKPFDFQEFKKGLVSIQKVSLCDGEFYPVWQREASSS